LHHSGPQSPPAEVGGDAVAAGPTGDRVVAEAAVELVVPRAAVDAVGGVARAQLVVAAVADQLAAVADLVELDVLAGVGADEAPALGHDQPLDAADVVVLAGPPVVGAAAERDRQQRLGVTEQPRAPLRDDLVGPGPPSTTSVPGVSKPSGRTTSSPGPPCSWSLPDAPSSESLPSPPSSVSAPS
jgi:hypothetical protein